MKWLKIERVPERCLWAALLLSTVYQSYRYPLKMNSAGSSPTYSDTPVALQMGKFLLVIPFCLISAHFILRRRLPQPKWLLVFLLASTSLYPLLKTYFVRDQFVAYGNVAFWPVAGLTLALAVPPLSLSSLTKYFQFLFIYALASNLIEILLFFTIGRLPALAYPGSISVRFGGFLDDPNGFPAILYMLMGWAFYRFSGTARLIALGSLLLCVLASESFTAFGFLALIALVFFFQNMVRRPKPLWIMALGAMLLTLCIAFRTALEAIISGLSEAKLGSVNNHLEMLSVASLTTPKDWLLGLDLGGYQESWWVDSVVNFGLPWALMCLGVVIALTLYAFNALRRARTAEEKSVFAGIFMLCCFFLLGNSNIPFFKTFPINFLFFLLSMLVFLGKIDCSGQVTPNESSDKVRRRRFRFLRYPETDTALTR